MPFSLYRNGRKDSDRGAVDYFIATPSAGGRPCSNYVMSMVDSTSYLTENGVKFDYWLHTEDCHVDDARNFLVSEFMRSGAKYLIFIDDDVGWDTESLARLLLFKDADIVGGAYPLRQSKEDYPVRIRSDTQTLQARPDGLLEVEGVPTGFMRIDRKVIEALSEKRKHLWFVPKEGGPDDPKQQVIFERMMVDGKRWSGDLNFCREARLLGFKVWVDPESNFSHQGNHRWEGHLGNYLRNLSGILDSRLDIAMDKLISGDASKENIEAIWKHYGQGYAAGPRMIKEVYDHCLNARGPILEVGAGITTIVGGIACARNGQTVHALEHDLEWFRRVRNYIQLWKVKPIALYYAPMKEYPELSEPDAKQPLMWYGDIDDLPKNFDVVIIDGPPRRFGREGAFKVLAEQLKAARVWIVDDVDDPSQMKLVQKYAGLYSKKIEEIGTKSRGVRRYALCT